ncbi:calmodulin-like [Toxorhynchites rutilus septentrionalis]|uniref:calmodulin-like n=1 Tax=Toxorhynchites rutilus septentrionalis TaxID=329112 RepID=UPI0024792D37|nr:calmodulin-like [Toxorhynchites rutilus septentrionalis]
MSAPKLTEEQIERYREWFEALDEDRNGSIPLSRLESALADTVGMGMPLVFKPYEEWQRMIRDADADVNGTIELHEFLHMMARTNHSKSAARFYRRAFKFFDIDCDGYMTPDELYSRIYRYQKHITNEELSAFMEAADGNKDGKISCDEFVDFMMS